MLRIGVGGYPPAYNETSFRNNRMRIFEWLRSLDINAFEAMMTYGPRTPVATCQTMRQLAKEYDIKLSVHAAYYIVLTSSDKEKVGRSIEMLKKTFEMADIMGADVVVLHPGSLYKKTPVEIAEILENNVSDFFSQTGKTNIGLFLETAGKRAQFGSVEEILSVTQRIEGAYPCIDFGHVHARLGGGLADDNTIDQIFTILADNGVFSATNRVHFHYTPIHYGAKGEIQHRKVDDIYTETDATISLNSAQTGNLYLPRYNRIIENLSKLNNPVTIISETHNSQEKGAMAMRAYYKQLGFK
ncbi:TIM barrel protein [Prevotella sp. 10(H)]|uniref:TIM barrel protein n=1 Tax=Prevotella sp. 10(H) TaxID=1158294 RepID=UPI0004A77A69|nr:TIM barrel protein [Prevotella sp. 10(H)]